MNEQVHTPTDMEIMDSARAALTELIAVNSRAGEGATCFLGIQARARRPSAKTIRKLEMDATLAERMRSMVLSPLTAAQSWLDDHLLHPYDPTSTVACLGHRISR